MIRCLIVDDEPLALEILQNYIESSQELELVKTASNAFEAYAVLDSEPVDLMFLDIKMPAVNGIEFIRQLKNAPALIFTTAYSEYAVTGFELDAIDYLLKPVTFERFSKSILKYQRLQIPEEAEQKNYSYFKVSGKLIKVMHHDLLFAKSVKDYIHLITIQGNYLCHMTMKSLDELLPSDRFLRVHRSYLVNKEHVNSVAKNQIEVNNEVVPVGENYREAVFKLFPK